MKKRSGGTAPVTRQSRKARRPPAFGLILEGFKSSVRAMRRLQGLRAAAVVVLGVLLWWTMDRL